MGTPTRMSCFLCALLFTTGALAGPAAVGGRWRTLIDKNDSITLQLPVGWYILRPTGYSKGRPPPGALEPKPKVANPFAAQLLAQGHDDVHVRAVYVYRDPHGRRHRTKYELSGDPKTMTDIFKPALQQVAAGAYATREIQHLKTTPKVRTVMLTGGQKRYWFGYPAKAQTGSREGPRHDWESVLLVGKRHLNIEMSCDAADAAKLEAVFKRILKSIKEAKQERSQSGRRPFSG